MTADAPGKILIVDDNPDNVHIFERALRSAGYQTEFVLSGASALDRVGRGDLDLVILDVMMPGMDGFQVLEALRSEDATRALPVLMITASFEPHQTARGMDLGANEYLTRPVHPTELLARVRSLLRIRNAERQREELRHELEEQRNLLRSIIDSMGEAVFVSDPQGRLRLVNRVAAELTGLSVDLDLESISDSAVLLTTPQGQPLAADRLPMARALSGEVVRGVEGIVVNPSTERETPIQLSSSPVRDGRGAIVAAVTVASNVSGLKGAEARARELALENARRAKAVAEVNGRLSLSAVRLQSILDEMPEGVMVAERATGRVVSLNIAARRLLRHTGEREISLGELPESYHVRRADGAPLASQDLPIWRALDLGETAAGEIQIARPGEPPVQVWMSAAPTHVAVGCVTEAVAVLRDVTEMRELDRLKDDFFFVAAHELKTPLTSIKGYAQLAIRRARRMGLSEDNLSLLDSVDRQCGRLVRLIDRLLDVSRIQLGRLQLEPAPMSLSALVKRVVEESQTAAPEHPVEVALPEQEIVGPWDEMRLEQVLSNLLSNAAKYSLDGGPIRVSVSVAPQQVLIAVRDEGFGIPPEDLPRIFERFYRSSAASQSRVVGLGLGLFVAREIVLAHGGEIWAESALGRGSTFYVRLPLDPP